MDLAPERIGGDTFLRPRGVSVRYLGNKSKLLSLLLIALRRQSGRGKHNGMAVGKEKGRDRCPSAALSLFTTSNNHKLCGGSCQLFNQLGVSPSLTQIECEGVNRTI